MDARVRRAIEHMELCYFEPITLASIARQACMSPFHFSRRFKQETGVSPAKYLKTVRMQQCCRLLEATSLSIKEVASTNGLLDSSHFVRDFKGMYGVSPTRYRNRLSERSDKKARIAN